MSPLLVHTAAKVGAVHAHLQWCNTWFLHDLSLLGPQVSLHETQQYDTLNQSCTAMQ